MTNVRWTVFKDYYKDDDHLSDILSDMWCILYDTEQEAEAVMANLKNGQDTSWYDPDGNEYAGYDAVLYVDQITL